jgi:hypothetical protein
MKKQPRKLKLNRETLRALESGKLQEAFGGNSAETRCVSECVPCDIESYLCH